MKRPVKPFEKITGQKTSGHLNADEPIIHHDDPELAETANTSTDLPEKHSVADSPEPEDVSTAVSYKELKVSSPAFMNNEPIPEKYTCEGMDVNPPLEIENIPPETKCLALIADDPDAPNNTFVHWVVWNIPVTHHIKENEIHGTQGINDFLKNQYNGPCPPSGTHRYFFKVYALSCLLDIKADSGKPELEKVMSKYIIGFGQLIGTYKRMG